LVAGDRIAGDNLQRLLQYSWPGNVRELRNVLERGVTLAQEPGAPAPRFGDLVFNLGPASSEPGTIGVAFPGVASRLPYKVAKAQLNESFDRAYVGALLKRHRGNVRSAAEEAELSRKHLYELIRRVTGADEGAEE
jgi:DNA-binding NtrC family response regulator